MGCKSRDMQTTMEQDSTVKMPMNYNHCAMHVFGILVIIGLITLIVIQCKLLKAFRMR